MIKSFKHKGLQKFFETGSKAGIQAAHAARLSVQLGLLNEITDIKQMDMPGWRLHSLSGNLKNHWSITVNGNWRLTFKFENGDAEVVDYQDYH